MANKKTKREFFGEIREIVKDNSELVAFIDHELELLDKKTSAKSTKVNTEQVELMDKIVNALNEMRNNKIALNEDTTFIDEVLTRVIDTPFKKRHLRIFECR